MSDPVSQIVTGNVLFKVAAATVSALIGFVTIRLFRRVDKHDDRINELEKGNVEVTTQLRTVNDSLRNVRSDIKAMDNRVSSSLDVVHGRVDRILENQQGGKK